MSNIEKYKKYFTKEYLMGPNSFRLLDELISRCPEDVKFDRTLDLGCGYALTSLFIANETDAKHVYAFDLWVPATENYTRITANGLVYRFMVTQWICRLHRIISIALSAWTLIIILDAGKAYLQRKSCRLSKRMVV